MAKDSSVIQFKGNHTVRDVGNNRHIIVEDGSLLVEGNVGQNVTIEQSGKGDVKITGKVGAETSIKSDGNVEIAGPTGRGYGKANADSNHPTRGVSIKAGGNIQVGASVNNHATLQAGGNIEAVSIASSSNVKAGGNVAITRGIYNASNIKAGGKISAQEISDDVTLESGNGGVKITDNVGTKVSITQLGKGDVGIGGNTGSETTIRSKGNVAIDGITGRGYGRGDGDKPAKGVTVFADGDITIGGGAGNHATFLAGGNIKAVSIASDSQVSAGGDVAVKYGIHNRSTVKAGGRVDASEIGADVSIKEDGQSRRSFVQVVRDQISSPSSGRS